MLGNARGSDGELLRFIMSASSIEKSSLLAAAPLILISDLYGARASGIDLDVFSAHSLRATAATNALEHQADSGEEWLERSPWSC
jgi:hypothetical protein